MKTKKIKAALSVLNLGLKTNCYILSENISKKNKKQKYSLVYYAEFIKDNKVISQVVKKFPLSRGEEMLSKQLDILENRNHIESRG